MDETSTRLHQERGMPDEATATTTSPALVPTRVVVRMRGVEREADLAKALETWRPLGGLGEGARFVLGGRLGQGSQGVVFALRDRDAQRTVALKTLSGLEVDSDDVSRFLHEVQVTAQLEHPGIVPIHDVGVLPDGTVFYTMKRVEGMVLSDWLVGRSGNAEHRFEVIQLFLKICDTMAFAHSRGVIHRDLKPRNIMVGTYGEVLIMDWGLAKVMGNAEPHLSTGSDVQLSEAADHETLAGTAVGTPAYMAPEQARGQLELVDHRSDIYGLAVILYEMLAAASPYVRGDMRRTLAQVVGGQWTRIDHQPNCRELPRRLCAIVHKAMTHEREGRYQHISEMAADLRAFLAGEAVTAYRETTVDLFARLIDRHRVALTWGGIALLAAGVLSGGGWWWMQTRDARAVEELRTVVATAVADGKWSEARKASEGILAYIPQDRDAQQAAARFDERLRSDAERLTREATQAELVRKARQRAADLRSQAATAAQRGTIEDLAEATQLAKQAQALHPEDPGLADDYERWVAALSQLRARQEQVARRDSEERQRRESALVFTTKSAESERTGDLDAAIGALRSALELQPDPAKVEHLGALVAQRRERDALAERRLREDEQRVARDARRAEADGELRDAVAALARGQATTAQGCVERAAALVSDHPGLAEARRHVEDGLRIERVRAAEVRLAEAVSAASNAAAFRGTLAGRTEDIRRLRSELGETGDPARRAALAAAEEAGRVAERNRAARLAEVVSLLNRALALAPDHPPVRAALAGFWVDRLRESEETGDVAGAAAAEAQAIAYDDGAHRDLLAGLVTVNNRGRAIVRLEPIVRQADRTDAPGGTSVELPSGSQVQLHHGHYVVTSADGVRVAVVLERGRMSELAVPTMPADLAPGTAFVPGGQLRDENGTPGGRIEPFVMAKREATCSEWLQFINDPPVTQRIDEALGRGQLILAPRATAYDRVPLWRRKSNFMGKGGVFVLELSDGSSVEADCPIAGISHDDAVAFAAWRARRDGHAWRLPTIAEWQLAVQGGDGRAYPWGSAADLQFCASAAALAREPGLAANPSGRFPSDSSVQGVLDLAGSRCEYCQGTSALGVDLRPLLGGSVAERMAERFTAWSRRDVDRRLVHPAWGVRLVYTP